MDEHLKQRIQQLLSSSRVFLFMKGVPDDPQCGFSAQAVEILRAENIPFASFNVLSEEYIRQGIKEYANWPTIPQLYFDGQFVGGCDILTQMHEEGKLREVLT